MFCPNFGLRYQSFPGYYNVKNGSRIVRMVGEREILFQQSIRGYPCRVWYKGQPIRCNIYREVGHLAASSPNKGLCRRCKEPGHTAGQCTKAWNTAQVSVQAVAGPSSSGVSPAAPSPRPQRGAVCERAPPASLPDPFEETKMLLTEAKETESVASDEDYTDSEVDEVDEAVSDGSNGISDYDTSEEDHLLEDVDLSLEKTRSASKRAKRDSGMESRNAPALAVSSSAAAVLVAPAAPTVPAAPASSAVQSSTPQCASGASKGNVSDISSVSESTEPKTLHSEITSVNNSVEGNVGCNVENNVTTENIGNSSVNICNEASVLEGKSVQLEKNVGVASATSLSSLSRPASLSPSRVPAEVAVSPELSGVRNISTRKSRAARFSPMGIWRQSGSIPGRRPSLVDQKNNSLVVVVVFFSFP